MGSRGGRGFGGREPVHLPRTYPAIPAGISPRPLTRLRRLGPGQARGITLALLSSIGLGLAVAVARYAYEGGTNGLTIASVRSFALVAALFVYCRATGRSLRLQRAERRRCAGLGLLMAMGFYGNVGAVEYISIGLTALLFFTFPPLIGLIQALQDRAWPAPARTVALAMAFAGLAMMLGVSLGASDPLGVALVLTAAVAVALNSVGIVRLVGHVNPLVAMFHMAVASAVVLPALALATGSVQLPVSGIGWAGMSGVVALQCASLPLYFVAIAYIGPLKTAMLANVQPVTSIVAARVLFAELLGAAQLVGGAMVLAGIMIMQWHDARSRR